METLNNKKRFWRNRFLIFDSTTRIIKVLKEKGAKKEKILKINEESQLNWIGEKGGKFCFVISIYHVDKKEMKSYTLGSSNYPISWDWSEFLKKSLLITKDKMISLKADRNTSFPLDTHNLNKTEKIIRKPVK